MFAILFASLIVPTYIQPANAAEVTVSHFIGSGGMGDSDGDSSKAKFVRPSDVATDGKGNLFVLDNNGVRKINSANQVTTLFKPSLTGNSTSYCGITVDKDSNIWFADCRRSILYKLNSSGSLIRTITLPYPQSSWISNSPAVDALPDGSVLVAVWLEGKVLRITAEGAVNIYYQSNVNANCNTNPRPAGIFCPTALTTSPTGDVYVLNQGSSGNEVLKITSGANPTKIVSPAFPTNVEFTNGALYVSAADTSNQQDWLLFKISEPSNYQIVYRTFDPQRWNAYGFKFVDASTLVIASAENQVLRKINVTSGTQSLIGNATFGADDGEVSKATINYPSGITEDDQGNIYFVDYKGIRKVTSAGIVTTAYRTQNTLISGLVYYNQKIYFIESNWIKALDAFGNVQQITNTNLTGDYPVSSSNSFAIKKNGDIYVVMTRSSDYTTKFIRKFNVSGGFKDLSPVFTNYAEVKIVIDNTDTIIVANNNQIKRYISDDLSVGNYFASYAGYSHSLSINKKDELYVFSRDQYSSLLNVIKANNTTENIINGYTDSSIDNGVKSGFGFVNGILASTSGNIYLSDSSNNSIRMVKALVSSDNSSNSGNTNIGNLRAPRSNTSWSRPSGLLPGLSEVRYKGYFNDNTGYFTDSAEKTLITSTLSSRLPIWKLSNEMGTNMSMWWGGYFIPDETGVWDFQLTSDDGAFMWIGNPAVSAYGNGFANAFISLPGVHPAETKTNSISLKANQIYPFRIQYGNSIDVGSFALEVKPPSYKSAWDTNLEGLIWHSDFSNREDCTNYGISYTLAAKLGYDIVDVKGCVNNPAKIFSNGVNSGTPVRPVFNTFNISGNTLNLNVNVGAGSNKPDKVYLVAPQLGINIGDSASSGKISGSNATWAIPLTSAVLGKSIQLQFISNRDGVDSDPLVRSIAIPNSSTSKSKNQSPPLAAISPKYVVSGAKIVVSAKIQNKVGANPMSGYLTAEQVGITAENSILGKISGNQITFTMPLLPSMMGKKTKTEIYMVNEMGESKPLSVTLSISAPKQPTIVQPTQRVQTVICKKGIQTRTFAGKKCPPGWN